MRLKGGSEEEEEEEGDRMTSNVNRGQCMGVSEY